jgi:hypothetical protein
MKNTDTLLEAARALITSAKLDENVDHIKSLVSTVKIGDSTNFGKVLEIGANSITFKAKDLPKTTIPFNARKMGSRDYVLDKLLKLKEALDPNDDAGVWIDDFVKSDNPKFSGKSKEERIKMALGAWYAAQKKENLSEEVTSSDIKIVLDAAKKIGGKITGNTIDFGMGAVIKVSVEGGKIKFDGGKSSGIEHFDNVNDAVMAFESIDSTNSKTLEEATDDSFYRLPGHVINNELFVAVRNLNTLQSSLRNGNDLDLKSLKSVIKNLNDIAKQAKSFKASDKIPLSYQYTAK